MGDGYAEKMQSYIEALEEERRKILVFERELPLCLEIITHAIGACKQQLSATGATEFHNNSNRQSECSEQTLTEGTETPVLEEFIPMSRRSRSSGDDEDDEEEEEHHSHKQVKTDKDSNNNGNMEKSSSSVDSKKSDWLKYAQLWNQSPDPPLEKVINVFSEKPFTFLLRPSSENCFPMCFFVLTSSDSSSFWVCDLMLQLRHLPPSPRKVSVVEVKGGGGAFQPFRKEQKCPSKSHQLSERLHSVAVAPTTGTSSDTEMAGSGRRGDREKEQTHRKQRRCWSPELHRRFLQALQQLGGSHAATPKQIRELMKVDDLTNDEVKSHLQKFRLHTRRPSPMSMINDSSSPQQSQILVVGGIWVPPPEYAAVAASDAAKAATAAPPTASAAAAEVNSTSKSRPDGGRECNSTLSNSSTSSSSHTTSASPSS
ncbi:hypothetical protein SAY86_020624 [Trapa natans]|uniref:HTH myb-type domain-containing protein n=1 Tax=Trapa natans TaxID=22666 RepID=A0AAN7R5Q7_TRANT|nr:hypothetical protein SAY86_020624 [Trapa natans]